jgi:hypothetical protein
MRLHLLMVWIQMLKLISELDNVHNFSVFSMKSNQGMAPVEEEVATPFKKRSKSSCTELLMRLL